MSGSKEEMICKNCKYHYIEDISFDYPQSCCSKRQCTTEQWCKCYGFEYSDRYIEQLQQENQKYKEAIDKAKSLNEEISHIIYEDFLEENVIGCKYLYERVKKLLDILKEVE